MLRLTLPVLLEQMLHLLVGFVDLWLTGNFLPGEAYVAAMTLMIYALWLVGNVFGFVALGSTAMTARFVGAGDREMANRVMNQSIVTGVVWALLLMAFALPLAGYFPLVMGLEGTAAAAAERYLTIELCVLPAVMVERVAVACLRGAGDMVSGLVTMAIVNVVNMVVSYALCPRHRAAARAGLDRHRTGHGDRPRVRRSDPADAAGRRPGRLSSATAAHAARLRSDPPHPANRRAGRHRCDSGERLPPDLLANHAVAGRCGGRGARRRDSSRSTRLHAGRRVSDFGRHAGRPIPGRPRPGPRSPQRDHGLRRGAARSWSSRASFSTSPPRRWRRFFSAGDRARSCRWPRSLLRIVAYAMPPLAITMVLIGALRGAGDTRWPLVLNLLGIVLLRVPLAYFLAHDVVTIPLLETTLPGAGLGVVGAWYAAVIDIVARCILMIGRFRHDAWQRIEV